MRKTRLNLNYRMIVDEDSPPLGDETLVSGVLSKDECNALLEYIARTKEFEYGLLGNGEHYNYSFQPNLRLIKTADLHDDEAPELYQKVVDVVRKLNAETYKYELYGLLDDFVVGKYEADNGEHGPGHFGWHGDIGKGLTALRKLSVIVGLNDPNEYEGGELHVFNTGIQRYKIPQGAVMVFPSFIQHRVTPVISGTRIVGISFAVGPRFR